MSEIERAIEKFDAWERECLMRNTLYGYPDSRRLWFLAAQAMREKQERERGCEYCNSRFGIATHHTNDAGLQSGTRKNAIFCPLCGKRLEVEHDE